MVAVVNLKFCTFRVETTKTRPSLRRSRGQPEGTAVISISRRQLSAWSMAEMSLFSAMCVGSMLLAVSLQLGPYGVSASSALIPA